MSEQEFGEVFSWDDYAKVMSPIQFSLQSRFEGRVEEDSTNSLGYGIYLPTPELPSYEDTDKTIAIDESLDYTMSSEPETPTTSRQGNVYHRDDQPYFKNIASMSSQPGNVRPATQPPQSYQAVSPVISSAGTIIRR
ncbi:hypothetical protein [Streptomyces sp. NPDC048489]|uniref:hypothetical protein n=1 Tax=Streptomyces sp. NPDC048489 TaxID=3154504 RepID=UPI0034350349